MKYYLTTLPGLEGVASHELKVKLRVDARQVLRTRNNVIVQFDFSGKVEELLALRSTEDVYVLLAEVTLTGRRSDLGLLRDAVRSAKDFDVGLSLHRQIPRVQAKKGGRRTTYRVVAQSSSEYAYRRVDAQNAVERGIDARYNRRWFRVEDDANLEVWLHMVERRAILGLRLTDRTMRHRTYKLEHLPASLRPTIAFAMVWLSGINENDLFLDPMCGAGTILIERAQAGRYKELLGGDIRQEAVDVAKANIGNKYKPISVRVWDARHLPLADNSVTKVVTNLPFGRQIGSPEELGPLYGGVAKEVARVLAVGGRVVFLTSEWSKLVDAIKRIPSLKIAPEHYTVCVLGVTARIIVCEKRR